MAELQGVFAMPSDPHVYAELYHSVVDVEDGKQQDGRVNCVLLIPTPAQMGRQYLRRWK